MGEAAELREGLILPDGESSLPSTELNTMRIRGVVPNIQSSWTDESRAFYREFLGLGLPSTWVGS